MAIEKNIFSSENFQYTITSYCNQLGWKVSDINASRAIIKFTMDSGNTQTVFILAYDSTLEFSCPSGIKYNAFDLVPHELSSYLLKENSKYKTGFWCIEEIGGKQVFSIMHNAEIGLMNVNYFVQIVKTLIKQCDAFEVAAEKA